ncbi:Adenosine deaminase-like protein [Portunus trituberculatus]|uniref:Adenosine deaminase-like protein n=1 Tax=Portunus trituberculatus TaxID=210409 RepID=A0A5B7JFW5_PORTR|nr:Adenosine deaminase-like protein [Portunus trituberculatus]
MELLDYCRSLPKVELHAHLNGSLSDATVLKLLSAKKQQGDDFSASAEVTIKRGHQRTVEELSNVLI